MENLYIKEKNQIIYLSYIIEKRELIHNYLSEKISYYSLVSKIERKIILNNFTISSKINDKFYDPNNFEGLYINENEIALRNEIMNLLEIAKNLFKSIFLIETCEIKKLNKENYFLYTKLNEQKIKLFECSLKKSNNNKFITFAFKNIEDSICSILSFYQIINAFPFSNNKNQINIAMIKSNKFKSKEAYEKILNQLNSYNIKKITNFISNEDLIKIANDNFTPIIIECGPSSYKKNQVSVIYQDIKENVNIDSLNSYIEKIKEINDKNIFKISFKNIYSSLKKKVFLSELSSFNICYCCMKKECIEVIKNNTNSKEMYTPFNSRNLKEKCIVCSSPSNGNLIII